MMTALQLLQLSADTTNRSNGSAGIIGLIIGIIVVAGLIWAFVWGSGAGRRSRRRSRPRRGRRRLRRHPLGPEVPSRDRSAAPSRQPALTRSPHDPREAA
ncbi:DUF6479 family protein [Streptacidiphilus monticola]